MLSLLAAGVAVMAMEQPLLGDNAPMPPTHSTAMVNRQRRVMLERQKEESQNASLVAQAMKLGEGVKDEGSGKEGMVRAFEKKLLVEFFYNRKWYDLAFFWDRVKPGSSLFSGLVLGQAVTGGFDNLANSEKLCPWTLGLILKNATSPEACEEKGEGFMDEYRQAAGIFFTFGVGLGMPLIKQRRYLFNLVLRCPRGGGRLYEVDPDQRRLNAVVDDLEKMSEFASYYLMRREEDRTTMVCRPIYNTLSLSSAAHVNALIACKKELEAIINYRDHEYEPARMQEKKENCKLFLYKAVFVAKQLINPLKWRKLTCPRRRFPSEEVALAELNRMREVQQKEKYLPGSLRDALVAHMDRSYRGRALRRAQAHIREEDSPARTVFGGASSSSGPDAAANPAEDIMEHVDSDDSDEMNMEIDQLIARINNDAYNKKLAYLEAAGRKVRDGVNAMRHVVKSDSNEVDEDSQPQP